MKKYYIFLSFISFFILLAFSKVSSDNNENTTNNNAQLAIQDTTFDTAKAIAEIELQIKGKEDLPAEEVFQNIKILNGIPAGRVVRIMKFAFNNSLGVNCTHCHVPGKWESEEKLTKQITRDMWAMVGTINKEMLPHIANLQSEQPVVNCTTCHRGDIKPGLRLK